MILWFILAYVGGSIVATFLLTRLFAINPCDDFAGDAADDKHAEAAGSVSIHSGEVV